MDLVLPDCRDPAVYKQSEVLREQGVISACGSEDAVRLAHCREVGAWRQGVSVGRPGEVDNVNIMHSMLLAITWRILGAQKPDLRQVGVAGVGDRPRAEQMSKPGLRGIS